MSRLTIFVAVFVVVVVYFQPVIGRKEDTLKQICARASYTFCRTLKTGSETQRDLPSNPDNGRAGNKPRTPFAVTPPPLINLNQYCGQYAEHYQYFCNGGRTADPKAAEFCPTYLKNCLAPSTSAVGSAASAAKEAPPAEIAPLKVQQICVDYQPMANVYCFRPEIPKNVKKDCDLYRKSCVDTGESAGKTPQEIIKDAIKQCKKSENDYIGFCVQNPKPYNTNVDDFCRNYKATCVPMQLPNFANAGLAQSDLAPVSPDQKIPTVPQLKITPEQLAAAQQAAAQQQQQLALQQQLAEQMAAQQMAQQSQVNGGRPIGTNNPAGAIGGSPWNMAGSPVSTLPRNGNPNIITDPLGSLGGNSQIANNPLGALGGPASSMPSPTFQPAGGPATGAGGFSQHPLTVGSQTAVGNIAGYSNGASINPFGQIGTGQSVLAGPVGIQSGSAVDFSGIPGLSQLANIPGLGRRRRRRRVSMRSLMSAL